jgi:hypothetical protein
LHLADNSNRVRQGLDAGRLNADKIQRGLANAVLRTLGAGLMLPPAFEPARAAIVATLPPLAP